MSRHRNVRSMNYTDEYDGYDDVYGHSVEDDVCMSPSDAAFMYNRDNTQGIASFMKSQKDIAEEDEAAIDEGTSNLSDTDKTKLEACLDTMRSCLGDNVTRQQMIDAVLCHNFNSEQAIHFILDRQSIIDVTKAVKKDKVQITQDTREDDIPSIKVVTSGSKQKNVIKGFDLNPKEITRLNTPRSQSPASDRGIPININDSIGDSDFLNKSVSKRENTVDVQSLYDKERANSKEHLYMVVVGHVDAGKSTLMGHLLCALGEVHQKAIHKYEQESRKLGKQSFMYAWVLDETGEERNRGITMDVGRFQFETETKLVTLLDAPGHKDFIPNMISGAAQADVALLVVDATRGEFETGFDLGGQTREHAILVRSLGVTQLAVVINKLDTVSWAKERFDDIKEKLKVFLKQVGFREADVQFVPCSGLTGQNLIEKSTETDLTSWYDESTLLEVINNFRSPERLISKPFRLSINDIYKGTGSGFCVSGRVETGTLSTGDRVLICPSREIATIKSISMEEVPHQIVFAGDHPSVTLSGIESQNVSVGYILCDLQSPVQVSTKFECRIVVFNVTVPITKGYPVVLHHQSLVEPAIIRKLITQLNRNSGELVKRHPRFLGNNTSAVVEMQVSRPIGLELYSDCKELGRVMLRVGGVTIAAGLITKIIL